MFDCLDARVHTIPHPLPRERVARDFDAVTMPFVDGGVDFVGAQSAIDDQLAVRFEMISGCGVQLDPIGAETNLIAHDFSSLHGTVHLRVPRR